jgi:hypothetical protein
MEVVGPASGRLVLLAGPHQVVHLNLLIAKNTNLVTNRNTKIEILIN